MSDAMNYRPQARSLPSKVLEFFVDNPEEELTSTDVAEKFGVTPAGQVSNKLAPVVAMGLLDSRKVGRCVQYTAGPRLAEWAGEPDVPEVRPVPSVPVGALEIRVTLHVHGAGTKFQRVEVVGVEP